MSVDILGTNRDQCVCLVQCCFTSTETVRLIRTGSPGRPPRLSHSSRTLGSDGVKEGTTYIDTVCCLGCGPCPVQLWLASPDPETPPPPGGVIEGQRFESASALLSLQKLWFVDTVL